MRRPQAFGHGLRRLVNASASSARCRGHGPGRGYATDAEVENARQYCLQQLESSDYEAHLTRPFVPRPCQDTYAALRALDLELIRLPNTVSDPTICALRMKFWEESLNETFAGSPPREPICLLLHHALKTLEERVGPYKKKTIKFWVSKLVKTREKYMTGRPFPDLSVLEDYAENTCSTTMYATLASLPIHSMHIDHMVSHIGKARGIVAVLRGIPVLAAPLRLMKAPTGSEAPLTRQRSLLLPLDVMAETGVKEEEVFRKGASACGLHDAVFKVATRANDHLNTANEMLQRLKAGEDPGHQFEHEGEAGHVYFGHGDVQKQIKGTFGVLLEGVPAATYLQDLQKFNFDPYAVKPIRWKLPAKFWKALSTHSLR